jgi:hypothetical protein
VWVELDPKNRMRQILVGGGAKSLLDSARRIEPTRLCALGFLRAFPGRGKSVVPLWRRCVFVNLNGFSRLPSWAADLRYPL